MSSRIVRVVWLGILMLRYIDAENDPALLPQVAKSISRITPLCVTFLLSGKAFAKYPPASIPIDGNRKAFRQILRQGLACHFRRPRYRSSFRQHDRPD